jgi:hypothetical protein
MSGLTNGPFAFAKLATVAVVMVLTGCSTMVTYTAKQATPTQSIRYTQGVGTVSERDETQEVFMYPTFKAQGVTQPTFTIGYANNAGEPINFAPENIKAFFRGQPVQIYTYTERIAEIQSEKQAKQIALAIIGGLAAGAAAHSASRQTYTSNYSGFASGRRGITNFGGSATTTVYNPAAGILAGAAIGGAAGLGIQQIAYDAQNQEQYANSILQANTVEPMQVVTGDLIIKTCCDPYPKADDLIRFEVTARGKTSVFEFMRAKLTQ